MHDTTPDEVHRQMQLAIDAAFENPSEDTKPLQNMMTFQENPPTPEEFVLQIARMLQDDGPFCDNDPSLTSCQ